MLTAIAATSNLLMVLPFFTGMVSLTAYIRYLLTRRRLGLRLMVPQVKSVRAKSNLALARAHASRIRSELSQRFQNCAHFPRGAKLALP